ncbi:MAG: SRPBCC family protein [bacterium]
MHTLKRHQIVDRPLEQVFDFFQRPENLALITPDDLDFQLLSPSPVPMEQGRLIDYTVRVLKVRVRWRTLISDHRPPYRFVDQQIKGPYSFWHHEHRFEDLGDRTRLLDEVYYALPLYMPFAGLIHRLYVRPRLEAIFDFRANYFAQRFGGDIDSPDTSGEPL